MGTRKIPSGDDPREIILPDEIQYRFWYCPHFPVETLGGRLDKDIEEVPWILGLLEDIRAEGRFRNPINVWNHHESRGKKQPTWLLRAGSNRIWCAEQLGWTSVPAVVSTAWSERCPHYVEARPIQPMDLPSFFPDGGRIWANKHGWGLLRAPKPELTYDGFVPDKPPQLRELEHKGLTKVINPLREDN